jgi:chemotaxis protein MotB
MGVFQASTTEVPIDVAEPMPFSTAQAINNVEKTASLATIASRPGSSLGVGIENSDVSQLRSELETVLAPEISRREIAIRVEPEGLIISLREAGFFESGSAKMKTTSQPAFDRIARMLRQADYRLRIEGHTDNVPIHNAQFASNWELSTSRATEIVRLLIIRDGFVPDRLSAAGYADYHPVNSNRTAEGRGMNRRVDVIILGKPANVQPPVQSGSSVPIAPASETKQPQPASHDVAAPAAIKPI